MPDAALVRKAMVDCQLEPDGVVDPRICAAFAAAPRESFVPAAFRGAACLDDEIPLGGGRYLLAPSVHARMLQALEPRASDVALDIGGGNGYPAAVLAGLVSTVMALESEGAFLAEAARLWASFSVCNVVGISGALEKGVPAHAPYDLIVVNGTVAHIPETLQAQLAPGGRLVAILRETPRDQGRAVLVHRESETVCARRILFDASTPYIKGFEPVPEFVF